MYYVYMMTNWNNKVIYTGITSDLERRVYGHKNKLAGGFTAKYNISKLVYFDHPPDVSSAIAGGKEIKGWGRQKKNDLVESVNPTWKDLSLGF